MSGEAAHTHLHTLMHAHSHTHALVHTLVHTMHSHTPTHTHAHTLAHTHVRIALKTEELIADVFSTALLCSAVSVFPRFFFPLLNGF